MTNKTDQFNSSFYHFVSCFQESERAGSALRDSKIDNAARRLIDAIHAPTLDLSKMSTMDLRSFYHIATENQHLFQNLKGTGIFTAEREASLTSTFNELEHLVLKAKKEDGFRRKKQILENLNNSPLNKKHVTEHFKVIQEHRLFEDPLFLFEFAKILLLKSPLLFLSHLAQLPLKNESEILHLALLLPPKLRAQFGKHFSIPTSKIEEAGRLFFKNKQLASNGTFGEIGICVGYTTALLSQSSSKPSSDLYPTARFIQATHDLGFKIPAKNPQAIGDVVLRNIDYCPQVYSKAAAILGYQDKEDLIKDFHSSEKAAAISQLVGHVALSMGPKIEARVKSLASEIMQKDLSLWALIPKWFSLVGQFFAAQSNPSILAATEALTKLTNQMKAVSEEKNRLLGQLAVLCNEYNCLFLALSSPESGLHPVREHIPDPIMKKLGLKRSETIVKDLPISHLPILNTFQKKKGKFQLCLSAEKGKSDEARRDHYIYITFDPPCFSDINQLNPFTLQPKSEEFKTVDEMVDKLRSLLELHYSEYQEFSIIKYKEI